MSRATPLLRPAHELVLASLRVAENVLPASIAELVTHVARDPIRLRRVLQSLANREQHLVAVVEDIVPARIEFGFLNKAVLDAELGVAIAALGACSRRRVESERSYEVKFHVVEGSVMELEPRHDAAATAGSQRLLIERYELEMPVLHDSRIVG